MTVDKGIFASSAVSGDTVVFADFELPDSFAIALTN